MQTDPKLLIKFPTKSRPDKFFSVLDEYIRKAKNLDKIAFLITLDNDDESMKNNIHRLEEYKKKCKLVYFFGDNKSKIQACNADMDKVSGWDIVLLASDDMVPVVDGYDYIIRKDMNDFFRDMDGVLWYNDGGQNNINTLSILGKKYYDKFGYIYHPAYVSLWCDNEFTDVSLALNKVYRSDRVIIEHKHPVYQKTEYDALYIRNESYIHHDQKTYDLRKKENFDLCLNETKWSVLLLGIPERIDALKKIILKLNEQVAKLHIKKEIEILTLIDNKVRSVGNKRQSLIDISKGEFISFIDDDDDISDDYIESIYNTILTNCNVDVITFKQIAKINNDPDTPIIFSLKHEKNDDYIAGHLIKRKPFHMCVWNSKIAKTVKFPDISKTEDWFWLKQLCEISKTEFHIDKFLHYYIFNSNTTTAND